MFLCAQMSSREGRSEKGEHTHNVSTLLIVGGHPEGMLPNVQGTNPAPLSAEILVIDLCCFKKAKQAREGNTD